MSVGLQDSEDRSTAVDDDQMEAIIDSDRHETSYHSKRVPHELN